MTCRVCHNNLRDERLLIKEKMFGTNEVFEYNICSYCEAIQIKTIPLNLGDYYPKDYYSYIREVKPKTRKIIKQKAMNIQAFIKNDFFKDKFFVDYGIFYNDRKKSVLDIGCGDGKLLKILKENGFSDLTGIDPFINSDYTIKGLRLHKMNVEKLCGRYHLIMSHHSLEHMPDPHIFFKNTVRLLEDDGRIILRIPIYPNYIWDKYNVDWIQLDAPRHLFTYTLKSIKFLCDIYELIIISSKYDSSPWSLASTEYCLEGKSHKEFEQNILITEEQQNLCKRANEMNYGDSIFLTLVKKNW